MKRRENYRVDQSMSEIAREGEKSHASSYQTNLYVEVYAHTTAKSHHSEALG